MGAGAIGGYVGARLALAGEGVTLIARGAHLAAIQDHGLTIHSPHGSLDGMKIKATDAPERIGRVDLIIFTMTSSRGTDLDDLIQPSACRSGGL